MPMLSDAHGVPLFYPTLYVTSQLRNAGAAVNTIRNKLADIMVLLRWQRVHRRDLVEEFRCGRFLSVADIASIRDFTKLDMRQQGGRTSTATTAVVVDFLESRIALRDAHAAVGGQQHFNRLSTIADYLQFVASVVSQHRGSAQEAEAVARMAESIRHHRPRGLAKRGREDDDARTPPTDVVERFIAAAAEGSMLNPFRQPEVQLRNSIIFSLFRHTGLRRGELLSLRIDQLDLGGEPRLWVRRNHDDAHDSRRYQPTSKTKERPLPLPVDLAKKINEYILRVRAKVPAARRHPYVFVSHRKGDTWGKPLSVSALNSQIFARMRQVDPAFTQIHPHSFRHHFNYELSVSIDRHNARAAATSESLPKLQPISEDKERDIRSFLNGHRSKDSGATYNRRHIREVSDRAARSIQDGIIAKAKATSPEDDSR